LAGTKGNGADLSFSLTPFSFEKYKEPAAKPSEQSVLRQIRKSAKANEVATKKMATDFEENYLKNLPKGKRSEPFFFPPSSFPPHFPIFQFFISPLASFFPWHPSLLLSSPSVLLSFFAATLPFLLHFSFLRVFSGVHSNTLLSVIPFQLPSFPAIPCPPQVEPT
jgi:hypothetical protein